MGVNQGFEGLHLLDTVIRWQRKLEVSKDRETSEVIGGLVYRFRLKRKIYKC